MRVQNLIPRETAEELRIRAYYKEQRLASSKMPKGKPEGYSGYPGPDVGLVGDRVSAPSQEKAKKSRKKRQSKEKK